MTIKSQITQLIEEAIAAAKDVGALPPFERPEIPLEHPRLAAHGDYSTSLPLKLAGLCRMPPMRIAETIVSHMPENELFAKVEVAAPGFINFTLSDAWLKSQVERIIAAGEGYGDLDLGEGKKVQVEFVSVNPTGPLHIGAGRNAALGDALANLLATAGYEVEREYYINDSGSRIELFSRTLYARYAQALGRDVPIPEDGYHGQYMVEMGKEIAEEAGDMYLQMPEDEAIAGVGELGVRKVLAQIRADMDLMGVTYDCWFSERSLYDEGLFDIVFQMLEERGYIARREGAVWFTSSLLGDEKDHVIIRSDGTPDYLASDIAYHYNKFIERGFDWVIDVWGADHQGHVSRMKAVMRALGLDPERLTLIIYQLATLRRGEEIVRLSKRTGDIITLQEVLGEVGADAVRFFLLSRSADSQMDFDLELAKEQSERNPVYYVQYAHVRLAGIFRHAGNSDFSDGDVSLLGHQTELELIRRLLLLPEVIELAVTTLAPHHLAYYAQDLAGALQSFYEECRVLSQDLALTKARLKLVLAAKLVLVKTLCLMGMSVPDRM